MSEFNFHTELVEEIRSINKTVQRGIECHSSELLLFPSTHVGKYCKFTPIQAKCIQFQKGCSFITKPLKKDFILKKKWTHALAWKTWKEDHGVHISIKKWGTAFKLVHDTKISTDIKWFCYQSSLVPRNEHAVSGLISDKSRHSGMCTHISLWQDASSCSIGKIMSILIPINDKKGPMKRVEYVKLS